MADKKGLTIYKGIRIYKFYGKPDGSKYLRERTFYKVFGAGGKNKPSHFDTLEDAKAFIRDWAEKEQRRDYNAIRTNRKLKRKK